nr:hypothetical protein [Methanocalculus sp. AMF5]
MGHFGCVEVEGVIDAPVALVCFGSTAGVCREAGERLGLRVVRVIVLEPFPLAQLGTSLRGVEEIIVVEENATGQLNTLLRTYGYRSSRRIGSVSGRPFGVSELVLRIQEVLQ